MMRIAIIGAGNVGSALGRGWLRAGEDVVFGVPNPADPKYNPLPRERLLAPHEAARNTQTVVLATPWQATETAVKGLGDLSGKIVIDCTNPLGMGPNGLELVLGHNTSAGEQVAAWRVTCDAAAGPSVPAIKLLPNEHSARRLLREAALMLPGQIICVIPVERRLLPLRAVACLRTNRPVMPIAATPSNQLRGRSRVDTGRSPRSARTAR